jgi:hypothetical protein
MPSVSAYGSLQSLLETNRRAPRCASPATGLLEARDRPSLGFSALPHNMQHIAKTQLFLCDGFKSLLD